MSITNALLGKPFDQVAFAVHNVAAQSAFVKTLGGDWVSDYVKTEGEVLGHKGKKNLAKLMFNYDFGPVEYEVLCYLEGDSWLTNQQIVPVNRPIASHYGWHVDNPGPYSRRLEDLGFDKAQDVHTVSHTNPFLVEQGRSYRYVIHRARNTLGADIKLIQRIE